MRHTYGNMYGHIWGAHVGAQRFAHNGAQWGSGNGKQKLWPHWWRAAVEKARVAGRRPPPFRCAPFSRRSSCRKVTSVVQQGGERPGRKQKLNARVQRTKLRLGLWGYHPPCGWLIDPPRAQCELFKLLSPAFLLPPRRCCTYTHSPVHHCGNRTEFV